ncbi:MAG TPA: Ig-like domain-containing protein [Gemmatimonadota bacterium]|nr:Ig-like domain-containing protein [Gemmatimonadota bacterium]
MGGLALAACDNSNTLVLDPNPAIRVVLDATACSSVQACGTCLLKAAAYDKNSKPAPFPTLIWSSGNTSRATVEQTGRVNGWRAGDVTIRVEVLETGAFDQVTFPVVVNPNISCTPPTTLMPATTRDPRGDGMYLVTRTVQSTEGSSR